MPDMTMTMSRPSPVPDTPASYPTSERASLAACIERQRQLAAHLADVRERSQAGIETALREAYDARAAAETSLQEAERDARSHALSRALGHATGPTVQQAKADLEAARQRFADAHVDRELVDAELARLTAAVDNARRARDEALAAVLSAAPGWRALMAELPAARLRVQRLENLFDVLSNLPGTRMPAHWGTPMLRDRPQSWQPDPALATLWTDAITALQTDANAHLPGDPAPDAEAA
jgi:hypothetical protein